MKQFLCALMIVMVSATAAHATDVGVSVSVAQPGFYGRIDVGNVPRPEVVYARPVVVHPAPVGVVYQPVYMHVPPGHAKHWQRYHQGHPVYYRHDGRYYHR